MKRRTWDDDPPVTPAERREIAATLSYEAAARVARHGAPDFWSRYLESLADIYAQNAERTERGEPRLPLPKLSELLQKIGA